MLVPIVLSIGLLSWSVVANLLIGEQFYLLRNVALVAALLALARTSGTTWSSLGLDRDALAAGLRWGRNAALAVLVVVVVGVLLADMVPAVGSLLADERADLPAGELAWNVLVRIPIGTAVFEEVAFRGVLLASLLAVTNAWWAVVWSSVVFGLWHVAPTIVALRVNEVAAASPAGLRAISGAVVLTTVAGGLFTALRLVSGSLLAPILAHWATNGFGLLAAAASGDLPSEHGE